MADTTNPAEVISTDEQLRMAYKRKLRKKRRADREAEGEIHDLNIYPMLDMMTIILVFLLKSYSASNITLTGADGMSPPVSTTTATPKETVCVTVTKKHIMLDNKPVLEMRTDFSIPDELRAKDNNLLIVPLKAEFDSKVTKLKKIAEYNSAVPFTGELSVIADQHVPYELLMQVLYTAGQAELANYRFIVIQGEGAGASKT
jgi:biopolymer transport protein ExbD